LCRKGVDTEEYKLYCEPVRSFSIELILWSRLLQKIVISPLIKKQPRISRISEVRLCMYKNPPLVHVQSPMNPIDIFPSYLSKVRFNIILPFAVGADSE
jgi:hypothetical protein